MPEMQVKMKTPDSPCECGHSLAEHVGYGECLKCSCKQFHMVNPEKAHAHTCEICGRPYSCSFPHCGQNEYKTGICNVCTKKIEDRYQGDLMNHLFGIGPSAISRIRAKKLAVEMKEAGVTVDTLFNFYKTTIPIGGQP